MIYGVKQIHFSGGENFLYKYFVEIVQYSKNKGFEIVINTNGYYNIESIIDYADNFIFSVHGLFKVHDKITGVDRSF